MLCVHLEAMESLLEELHEGIYGATQGEDPWLTKPLPRGISGPVCRSLPGIKRGNVINARGTL